MYLWTFLSRIRTSTLISSMSFCYSQVLMVQTFVPSQSTLWMTPSVRVSPVCATLDWMAMRLNHQFQTTSFCVSVSSDQLSSEKTQGDINEVQPLQCGCPPPKKIVNKSNKMGKDGLSACCKTLHSNLRNSRSFSQFQKDFSGLLIKKINK